MTSHSPPDQEPVSGSGPEEAARRRKERWLILAILSLVGLLTFAETRITHLGDAFPISNAVLVFVLINTNLLLLLALILLVFRNLVKLYYEKKNNLFGTRFKTKLVAAFVALALLPTTVLFYFSIHFISRSISFWFDAPVEQTLDTSLDLGRRFYNYVEERNRFFAQRAAFQIQSQQLLLPDLKPSLQRHAQVIQRAFHLYAVEVYSPDAQRRVLSMVQETGGPPLTALTSNDLLDLWDRPEYKSIIQQDQNGELVRTLIRIPHASPSKELQGFLVITARLPTEISRQLGVISQGAEKYRQLKMMKKPAQWANTIALGIVALLVVFCAVWFGFYLAKSITIPLLKFAEGTQRVSQGDLNYRIDFESNDEIGTLIRSFNAMTRELSTGREQLAVSEKKLRLQNREMEKSRRYMAVVLKHISAGVISVDEQGNLTTINKAAEAMLNLTADQVMGRDYRSVFSSERLDIASKIADRIPQTLDDAAFPLTLTINGVPRHFAVHINLLKSDSGENLGAVMVLDDVTQLEKAQRMAAWREVARRIAHEVKNPLTPIKLSAQRLKRKYGKTVDDEVFDQCVDTIVSHVNLIRNLVNEFSTFARFPDAAPRPGDLPKVIHETVALYREGLPGISFHVVIPDDLPQIHMDHRQIKQAMINLIDNAVSAMHNRGRIDITVTSDPILKLVRMEVADTGPGISDEQKIRLFEPYFSTKSTGMGLGLAIVSSIITDHGGMIRVQDNTPKGARFVIELPMEA